MYTYMALEVGTMRDKKADWGRSQSMNEILSWSILQNCSGEHVKLRNAG